MILSDKTILEYIESKKILVFPEVSLADVRPVGIRLHLGNKILLPNKDQQIDLTAPQDISYEEVEVPEEGYIIRPNDFILATTYESFQVPRNIVCHIDGRSTVARTGLSIHCTSQTIDGNFDEPRSVVFEMKNNGPLNLVLRPRLALAMLLFEELTTDIGQNSQNQYRGQSTTMPPNLKLQKQ